MPRPLKTIDQELVNKALAELKNLKQVGVLSNRLIPKSIYNSI
jgi:hypothetical protein